MAANKKEIQETIYRHKEGSEWLTLEICNEYRKRAMHIATNNVSARKDLVKELQERCDITELQAINVIRGFNVMDYVAYYERMRNKVALNTFEEISYEYLEWLTKKEFAESSKKNGEYNFEEKD